MHLKGRLVTIMGLGHFGGGASAARWLARRGAEVTVTDLGDEDSLADSLSSLAGEPIARFHLGGHREADFRHADLVVVNPAVRPGNRFVEIAAESGVPRTSETELFLQACPARIIGVTGSNGKSTTAAMTAAILRAEGRTVWLGGNIGTSLLDRLDEITPDDGVVLELSSFQLNHLNHGVRMPELAVVTNCRPNHLDWHGNFTDYRDSKQRILTGQEPGDLAVLNTSDAEVASWLPLVRGRRLRLVPEDDIPPLAIPGDHNRANAVCAATAALGAGCGRGSIERGLASFSTLTHRLESVAVTKGRRLIDDSSSTTPDSTIAGLRALEGLTWLLAGGHDKGIDSRRLIVAIVRHARGAAFYGAVRERLYGQAVARAPGFPCAAVETMDEALRWCWQRSRPGDGILLSPAYSSHDQFSNFQARGATFAALAGRLGDPYNP
ncbi:MAG: UDP-N-acetylmuramoyl-L-alanine--D-glutamate ligase [Planctomycetota bacterium]